MVAVVVVDPLEVVEVGKDDGQRRVEHLRPFQLGLERLDEPSPVDQVRQLVGRRLAAHFLVEPRVLERDPGLRGDPLRELLGLDVEALSGGVEEQLRV